VAGLIREQILTAAAACIRSQGMAKVTTKDIARHAGCSEGSIYNHFDDKLDLLRAVIAECLPDVRGLIGCFTEAAGQGSVRQHLEQILEASRQFFTQLEPLIGSVFGDPELLARLRADMDRDGTGPQQVVASVADYLRAEQGLGRINQAIDPEAAGLVLIGAASEYAHIEVLTGEPPLAIGRLSGVLDLLCLAICPPRNADTAVSSLA
jgi:AcrR family transcriptional regulator